VRRSLELTARLPLDEGDVVYLSPVLEHEGSAYARRAREEGLHALDADEIESQYVELRDGIRRANPRIRVTRYDIREFVY
jgi:hypothetical protein